MRLAGNGDDDGDVDMGDIYGLYDCLWYWYMDM
jgi:hypothetical protein